MKTAKETIEEHIDYWGDCQKEDIIKACIEYAKEAIKADRENIVKHAKIYDEGYWNEGECHPNYKLDENSIINAPSIELK